MRSFARGTKATLAREVGRRSIQSALLSSYRKGHAARYEMLKYMVSYKIKLSAALQRSGKRS